MLVEWINLGLSRLFDAYAALTGGLPPWVSMTPLAVSAALVMLFVFRHTSSPKRIERSKSLLRAYLMEMRLFSDEPALVFGAQGRLLLANAGYLFWMAVPIACASVALWPLLAQMERYYGQSPLKIGETALFTVHLDRPVDTGGSTPRLVAPAGIEVETPAVRVEAEQSVVWRIRATGESAGILRAEFSWGQVEKRIETGGRRRPVDARRVAAAMSLWLHPGESRLPDGRVEWAEIEYPSAEVPLFGLSMHWLWALMLISMPVALLLKRRFGVVF
ncbi:hypothetical protein [Paludibaculum fermentans]|uniref:Uncharacterized protein n=1 Tax=Paludibaculum fermentans TaxID=1473598 RepID=A0A7S7NJW2_PALFE|nr:hypothetical protein [Paludibaculum fermentans]QOY84988.1 hypothetical protein IRI77_19215 [Paludibaculum fermentans]